MHGRNASAHITQKHCTDCCHESCTRYCLGEGNAMIAGVRSAQVRELAAALPVKPAVLYDHAA